MGNIQYNGEGCFVGCMNILLDEQSLSTAYKTILKCGGKILYKNKGQVWAAFSSEKYFNECLEKYNFSFNSDDVH